MIIVVISCYFVFFVFFFFKQKTAYEMRISDWSSDVCSSDLNDEGRPQGHRISERRPQERADGDQPVFSPLPNAGALGRQEARQVRIWRIDRRYEARAQGVGAHPVPCRPPQFPAPRPPSPRRQPGTTTCCASVGRYGECQRAAVTFKKNT